MYKYALFKIKPCIYTYHTFPLMLLSFLQPFVQIPPPPRPKSSLFNFYLKGVFAKNKRGYMLTAKNKRFWSLLILYTSICCVYKEKIVINNLYWRTQHPYKFRKLQYSDRTKINLIPNKSIHTTYNHRLFFDAFVYS